MHSLINKDSNLLFYYCLFLASISCRQAGSTHNGAINEKKRGNAPSIAPFIQKFPSISDGKIESWIPVIISGISSV
jgi:hypothetical protein